MTETKRSWWERTDEGVERDRSWIEDYRFDEDEDGPSLDDLWSRYGTARGPLPPEYRSTRVRGVSPTEAARFYAAHQLVQGFVDTFSTDERTYRVSFDPGRSASTDLRQKLVHISHRPLLDPALTTAQANKVMTGQAAHELTHIRYGRGTHEAVLAAFPGDARAHEVGNILDDIRGERRWAAEFPGFADVFEPVASYIFASSGITSAAELSGINFLGVANRYADHVEWPPETVDERDFWIDWAERAVVSDDPDHHVAAVREALAYLDAQEPEQEPEPGEGSGSGSGSGGTGDDASDEAQGESEGSPTSGEGSGGGEGSGDRDAESPTSLPTAGADGDGRSERETPAEPEPEPAPPSPGRSWGGCPVDLIDDVAPPTGATARQAEDAVDYGEHVVFEEDAGAGEVYTSPRQIPLRPKTRALYPVRPNATAAAAIREAFLRSRTGHAGREGSLRSGRLDNRSIHRIASDDYRLFAKRTAQSETKYRVWLLVDHSGSMAVTRRDVVSPSSPDSRISQTREVAAALAAATRNLPNVHLSIYGWTSGFAIAGAQYSAVRVYTEGEPIANIGALGTWQMGGTPDASVVAWASAAIRRETKRDETPVIILASDGDGYLASSPAVANARKAGVLVFSVAIGAEVNELLQERVFGRGYYIPWAGSIQATARPLGRLLGKLAGS